MRVAEQAVARRPGQPPAVHPSGSSSRRRARATATCTWVSPYDIDPFAVPDATRSPCSPTGSGLLAHDGVDHVDAAPARRGREQVLRRPRRHHDDPAAGADQPPIWRRSASTGVAAGSTRCARSRRRSAAAGSTSPGTGHDWAGRELAELPELARREAARRRASRPARYDLVIDPTQPVAHHPRVDRARHRAGPGARATRPPTPARHSRPSTSSGPLQYGSPVMNITGDRTPSTGWPRSGTTTRAWPVSSGTSSRTACWSATSWTGRWPGSRGSARVERLRVRRLPRPRARCSGWPTSRCSRPPTAPRPTS